MILEALLERPGMPVSRERLELTLYGWNGVSTATPSKCTSTTCAKTGQDLIRTVRGLGYMIPETMKHHPSIRRRLLAMLVSRSWPCGWWHCCWCTRSHNTK